VPPPGAFNPAIEGSVVGDGRGDLLHDVGCHFAAWEQPELLTADLRAAFRSLR
jgi:hypothetical protein